MYRLIDNTLVITVNDWCKAGLTYKQFNYDSTHKLLKIYRRGKNGNTLIDVQSIRRPERLEILEKAYGHIKDAVLQETRKSNIFYVSVNSEAREFFLNYTVNGVNIPPEKAEEYVNKASIFDAIRRGLEIQRNARAKTGKKLKMGEFWEIALTWFNEQMEIYPCSGFKNARSFERTFKNYLKEGYISLIHKNFGNDSARKVSDSIEKLLLALWRMNEKPFISRVHELYKEFMAGKRELYDRSTGEVFRPETFFRNGEAMEISIPTVWKYLKDVVNETSVFMDRNGNFEYMNSKRPKHHRHHGRYTLSKISMDDVALSRKSNRGWVYKYMAVDVLSGYWFRPAYIVGKPTLNTVMEAFRNMFCELDELGLPMPGELEVENHLMKDILWLKEVFPFVRFCQSPTEKRAEHHIRSLKYGISKKEGHTRGRWYARHEAYKTVRNKVSGDFVEPEFQPRTIVADDLSDIEKHNNSLHPMQRTFPGMTRKEVLIKHVNPELSPLKKSYLYRYIGNCTHTTLYNNDYCPVQQEKFELKNFESLERLKSNNVQLEAFWLPEKDGTINQIYLYQGDLFIGEAVNKNRYAYNENRIERTEADRLALQHQNKRIAIFDKYIRDHKNHLPRLGYMDKQLSDQITETEAPAIREVIPEEPEPFICQYDQEEWKKKAISNL